jgi:hypothetical protein
MPLSAWSAMAGAALTLLALAALGAGGYLLALRLLGGERARADTLQLAVATLLCASTLGVGVGLALGACGQLRIAIALPLQIAVCALLARWPRRLPWDDVAAPARLLAARAAVQMRRHLALTILAGHAIGSEALRGLLRPPLSWDSLMYHLLLTATWLQRHDLAPVFGVYPLNYYGYAPANGSVWLWWWMAPAHGEIYANLAFLPQWLLFGLATGAVARRLGARHHWPLAAFLAALAPTVVRFAATQYVDIFTAACLLAACACGLAWLDAAREAGGQRFGRPETTRSLPPGGTPATAAIGHGSGEPETERQGREANEPAADAVWRAGGARAVHGAPTGRGCVGLAILAGLGVGLAAGAKVLGLIYAGAPAGLLLLLVPGGWRRRILPAAAMLGAAAVLGSFFYLRNLAHGAGPLALQCEGLPKHAPVHGLPRLPRPDSVAALPYQMLAEGRLARALLGSVDDRRSPFADLGLGPQALLAVLGLPALALLPRRQWRETLLVGGQLVAQIGFWAIVPYAANNHVFANIRYLLPAVGLAFAAGVAAVDRRRAASTAGAAATADDRWLGAVAVALVAQDLLQLHTQLSDGLRLAVAVADVLAVVLATSPRLRRWLTTPAGPGALPGRPAAWLAAAACLAAILAAPCLARFRAADRTRAFNEEFTAHGINVAIYASGWDWLDRHGADGTVAVVNSPDTFFIYPAMGPGLARRALYVNVNAADLQDAAAYPLCLPRVAPAAAAWLTNLRRSGVRWLDLSRIPPYPFAMEDAWARARPDLFVNRFADANNRIYELLPAPAAGPPATAASDTGRSGT